MHMLGQPRTMQLAPAYQDAVTEVIEFLRNQAEVAEKAGLSRANLVFDPGFGFGKTLRHNLQILNSLERFTELGSPVLVGISRKSMIGAIVDQPVEARTSGSIAAAVICALKGASIIRAHDVGPTVEALRVVQAVAEKSDIEDT
jgi:dihydropteroate synthase